ncbi:MAG: YciI family protein [Anaeromyxobacteraceae bacterium]|nr:YciI family protein [Anaeromyxobacteraceae bacterium]
MHLSPRVLAVAAALAFPALAAGAEANAAKEAPKGAPFEMERFQLVLLVRAPTWKKLPDAEASALQAAHLAHLTRMWETDKAVVCGPFGDQADASLRGACIYAVKDVAEARALAEEDPVVKAGQLRIEAVTWWVGKGYMTFPKRPAGAK